jgi:DNA-binding transcriptional LysR family regulator
MARNANDDVSMQQLRALAAIADTGSFTLAAEALQLTQPAISHLVRRMEEQLGQPLVVRGRRIRLTGSHSRSCRKARWCWPSAISRRAP